MPDLQSYALTFPGGTQNLTAMPRMQVQGRLIDSNTGAVIPNGDFTGSNAFDLLAEIKNRTQEQQIYIANQVALILLYMKAGIWEAPR